MALFDIKNVKFKKTVTKDTAWQVTGDLTLLGLRYLGPLWVVADVSYPKRITDVLGAPEKSRTTMAFGGAFKVEFEDGFDREGEYKLDVNVYGGPSTVVASTTIPPFPPVASIPTMSFAVGGQAPTLQETFRVTLLQPTADPNPVVLGQPTLIKVPFRCATTVKEQIDMTVIIQEASILPSPGKELTRESVTINTTGDPSQLYEASLKWVASGELGNKDVTVEVRYQGKLVTSDSYDDVFRVVSAKQAYNLTFGQPLVNGLVQPHNIAPGQAIIIEWPISNPTAQTIPITGSVSIYQETFVPLRQGDLIVSLPFNLTLLPNTPRTLVTVRTTADSVVKPKQLGIVVNFPDGSKQSQLFSNAFYVEVAGGKVGVSNVAITTTPTVYAPRQTVVFNISFDLQASVSRVITINGYVIQAGVLFMDKREEGSDFRVSMTAYPGHNGVLTSVQAQAGGSYTGGRSQRKVRLDLEDQDGSHLFGDVFAPVFYVTEPLVKLTLKVVSDPTYGGTVSVNPQQGSYDPGDIVTLKAFPNAGYRFDYWDVNGQYLDNNPTINYAVMTTNYIITAHFGQA